MPINDNRNTGMEPWYVMCHPSPKQIDVLLRRESEGWFLEEGQESSPFRFYIPYLYMPTSEPTTDNVSEEDGDPDEQPMASRELRSDFHSFVFIQASAARVDSIVNSKWNKEARLHLYYYRDHERRNILVEDSEVRRLMDTFRDKTLRFFIGQPIDEFAAGDRVIFNTGAWTGRRGIVKDIRLKKGKLTMTISVSIFNRLKSINFTDLKTGDVTFEDAEKARLLNVNPVSRFEEEIIDILNHGTGKTMSKDMRQADLERLRRLSMFDRIFIEDSDADFARILSLRLICAVLRKSRKSEALQRQLMKMLNGREIPATDDEAYLMTALFIATRNAGYRNAVKAYRNAHPEASDILRRYHSIVKKMRAKSD